jgi:hypothetical protein
VATGSFHLPPIVCASLRSATRPVRRSPGPTLALHALSLLRIAMAPIGAVSAAPLSAQMTAAIDGTGSRITYAGANGLSTVSLSPTLEWLTPSASFTAGGSFSQFTGGGWTLQGSTAGSLFTPAFAGFRGELAGGGVGSTYQDGSSAGEILGRGRLHWLETHGGAWIGGAIGGGWNGLGWQTDRRADLGAWLRRNGVTLAARAAPTWLGDSLRFLDADLTLRSVTGPVELSAFGGSRHWSRPGGAAGSTWGGGSGAVWFGPHLSLVAAGGSYPVDYAQGLPAGTYVSLGLRLASRRSGRDTPQPVAARVPEARNGPPSAINPRLRTPAVATFEVRASGAGRQTFRVNAPAARTIELMGDFTQWRAVRLLRASDGTWSVTLPVSPGVYRMNVRVDDRSWGVPPGVPALTDDFGGVVGLLQVGAS